MPDKNGDFNLRELQHPTTLLARLYAKKLPKYGWAGRKNPTEKEYIKWFKKTHKASPDDLVTRKECLVKLK